ncbi:ROK family protein [Streptomyces sp. NPDC048636]|uniref:ROK family protein n=1 Tax=Streptomyces sp. NPDC048636 TaxID=3155762 RepID=UPI00343601E7
MMYSADADGQEHPARPDGGPPPKVARSSDTGPESLRRRNMALVARTLLHRGPAARSEIAHATGLSATSVTKITAQMARARMVVELGAVCGGDIGRPRVPVALDTSYYRFVGIHIGMRRITGGLLDLAGNVVVEHAVTHRGRTRKAILREARELRDQLRVLAGGPDRILGTGVATGGRVDPHTGVVVDHPLIGWKDVRLRDELDIGDHPVFVDSSVRAMALAETYLGVARDTRSSLFLFIGNIVGAGLMVDGRPRLGHDAAAGTIDHLPLGRSVDGTQCRCGRGDCLAALGSDVAVLERARRAGLVRPNASFESLVAKSRSGSAEAAELLRERAEFVGIAAGIVLDLFDPDLLVLGGGLLQTPEHLDSLRAAAADRLSRPEAADRIVPTGLGEGALVRGSGSLPMHSFFSDPVAMLRTPTGG